MGIRFPLSYRQKNNLNGTLLYIGTYVGIVHNFLNFEKKAIYVDSPVIFNTACYQPKTVSIKRTINFDSKFDNEIYQFQASIEEPFNDLIQKLNKNQKISLYTYYSKIERDINQSENSALVTRNFYLEFQVVEEEINNTNIQMISNHYFDCIKEWNFKAKELTNISDIKYQDKNMSFTSFSDLEKNAKWSSLKNEIDDMVEKNGPTLVSDIYRHGKQGETLFERASPFNDLSLSSALYIWDNVSKEALPILKVMPRSLEQRSTKEVATIAVEILFNNLMKINLGKSHLAEVTNSPWNKKFIDYVLDKKIDIL